MFTILRHQEPQAGQSRTVRFEGWDYGSQVSFFLVDNEPGQGPGLHVHPYPETWIVRRGEAEFTVGDDRTRAHPGDIVVAAANVPHRFENVGAGGSSSSASTPATGSCRNSCERNRPSGP